MEIQTELTKQVFEYYVPSAKTPERSTQVYDRLAESFSAHYHQLVEDVIGALFVSTAEKDSQIKSLILRYVSISSFVSNMRSLDVVLTATGFGVVNTNSLTPASQARVDRLMEELQTQREECRESIIRCLTSIEGWGDSSQAHAVIDRLFWRISQMKHYSTRPYGYTSWQAVQGSVLAANANIARCMGNETMDVLLIAIRHDTITDVLTGLLERCYQYISITALCLDPRYEEKVYLSRVEEYLEEHADELPAYKASSVYVAKHMEHYKNKANDTSFFFTC